MKKLEQKFCTDFQKWIKYNHWGKSFAWEAKVATEKSLNYKQHFPEHQLRNLMLCRNNVFVYKLSDLDQLQKPFDGVFYTNSEAYYVIKWDKEFYIIDAYDIQCDMKYNKSLTEDRARTIAYKVGVLASRS